MLKLDHNPSQTHVRTIDQTWKSYRASIHAAVKTEVNVLLSEACDDL